MKSYPSIPHWSDRHIGENCICFKKEDGSQIRFEWSRKTGWYKYGTRNRLFDINDPDYGCAIDIFADNLAVQIIEALDAKKSKIESVIAFAEFFGPNSFAGQHVSSDPKQLVLFDVNVYKKGLIAPDKFVEIFRNLPVAEVIYTGPYTEELIIAVQEGEYDVGEGVVVKGGESPHKIWMEKIKTNKYLARLKEKFSIGWEKYW